MTFLIDNWLTLLKQNRSTGYAIDEFRQQKFCSIHKISQMSDLCNSSLNCSIRLIHSIAHQKKFKFFLFFLATLLIASPSGFSSNKSPNESVNSDSPCTPWINTSIEHTLACIIVTEHYQTLETVTPEATTQYKALIDASREIVRNELKWFTDKTEINHLVKLAEKSVEENNLVERNQNNAAFFYTKILFLDPNNKIIEDKLTDLLKIYIKQIVALAKNGESDEVREMLTLVIPYVHWLNTESLNIMIENTKKIIEEHELPTIIKKEIISRIKYVTENSKNFSESFNLMLSTFAKQGSARFERTFLTRDGLSCEWIERGDQSSITCTNPLPSGQNKARPVFSSLQSTLQSIESQTQSAHCFHAQLSNGAVCESRWLKDNTDGRSIEVYLKATYWNYNFELETEPFFDRITIKLTVTG